MSKLIDEVLDEGYALTPTHKTEQGTYVCLLPDTKSQNLLNKFCEKFDLAPVEEFHSTLVYSSKHLNWLENGTKTLDEPIEIEFDGFGMLGELDNEYRALCLNYKSAHVQQLFDEMVDKGYMHHYNEFKPHISLSYTPDEEHCKELLSGKMHKPKFKIRFNQIKVEPIK